MSADRVQGGTNAGWKPPFNGQPQPWQCHCYMPSDDSHWSWSDALKKKTNLGALRACPDCGATRP